MSLFDKSGSAIPPQRRVVLPSVQPVGTSGAGGFTGSGDLAGTGLGPGVGAFTGSGTIAAASSELGAGVGVITGSGTMAAASAQFIAGAGGFTGGGALAGVSNSLFPIAVHASGRYLVRPDGTPFLLCADTTWSLFEDIPLGSVSTYFSTLISQGFNAVSSNAIEHHYTTVKPPKERGGLLPFTQTMNGASFTGSPNGTTAAAGTQGQFASDNYSNIGNQAPDCTFINNSYWLAVEQILDAAVTNGIMVLIWPGYLGFHANDEGWLNEMVVWDAVTGAGGFTGQSFANPAKSKMWNYGSWMAARWKNYPNIIWVMGGDYGSNSQTLNTAQASAVSNLMAGLKSVAGQQSLLFTAHWDRPAISADTALAAGAFDINGCYADESVAELARRGYAATPTKPTIGLEYFYEGDLFGGSAPYRKYVYWQYLGGIAGGFYGQEQIWRFDDGTPGVDWTTLLATQARLDAARQFALWKTLPWHRLKPSGLGGMISLVTAGGGTASPQSTTYVAAAATPEGDLLLAYIPPDHTGTITVAMTAMAASARARWFDPTNNSFTAIGMIANTGTHVFTPPATNNAGDTDFLLVLDTPAGAFAGSGDMAGTTSVLASGAGGFTGSGAIAGIGASLVASPGALAGSGALAGVGAAAVQGGGALAGTGSVAATGAELATGIGALAGASGLAGAGASIAAGSASLAGVGALAGIGAEFATGAASMSGSGDMAASGSGPAPTVGAFSGSGAIAGAGTAGSAGTGTGSLSGSAAFVGGGAQLVDGTGALTGSGAMAGGGAALVPGQGDLAGTGGVVGAGAALNAGAAIGVLDGSGAIAAAASSIAAGAGAFTGTGQILGQALVIATGPLTGRLAIEGMLFGRLQDGGPDMIDLIGPLTVYRGDDADFVLIVSDDTNEPVSLTAATAIEVQVKPLVGAADPPTLSKSLAAGTIQLLNQADPVTKGRAVFGFSSSETDINPGLYMLDAVVVMGGKRRHVITPREFTIAGVVNPP